MIEPRRPEGTKVRLPQHIGRAGRALARRSLDISRPPVAPRRTRRCNPWRMCAQRRIGRPLRKTGLSARPSNRFSSAWCCERPCLWTHSQSHIVWLVVICTIWQHGLQTCPPPRASLVPHSCTLPSLLLRHSENDAASSIRRAPLRRTRMGKSICRTPPSYSTIVNMMVLLHRCCRTVDDV